MGLKSFFQRKEPETVAQPPASGRGRKNAAAPTEAADAVLVARARARQRLIGAVVLLGIGIIGFPLLFETQPRPIPVDIPIDIPRKDNAPPLQMPAPRVAAQPVVAEPAASVVAAVPPTAVASSPIIDESAADAGHEVAPPVAATPAPKVQVAADKPMSASAAPADAARAMALLEGKPADKAASGSGRFIVQVGAFAEATAARDVRQKVEKLGLKTYMQAVDTESGKRIRVRVGPFASRDEAVAAASKIKSAGLGSVVLTI